MIGRFPLKKPAALRCCAAALALCLTTSCRPDIIVGVLPPGARVDSYTQQAASAIDVLWVIDDSGSMAPRQENLARNFSSFIDVFSGSSIDFRIAVTTTDVFKTKGQFKGTPKVLRPDTANLVAAFAANVKVGSSGSAFEAGLEGAQLALDRVALENAPKLEGLEKCKKACVGAGVEACQATCTKTANIEFLRPDAFLYLIFVSDEEDESSQDVRYYWRSFETAKGIGNDGTVTTATISGESPNTCNAAPGTRYRALSALTGGEVGSICDPSFAASLKKLANNAIGLKRKFALGAKPAVSTIEVKVRYACNTPDAQLTACVAVDKAPCTDKAADAVALVCTPRQGGPDGWAWEAEKNVIFFAGESAPRLGAEIDVQYYEEGKQP